MATCNVSDLLQNASCFCKVTVRPFELVELQLLCEISAALNGEGGAGGGTTQGSGAPSAPPLSGNGLYYDNVNFDLYVWNAATSHWDFLLDL